ncbi:MFS transporter [Bounagaea algeriensis]
MRATRTTMMVLLLLIGIINYVDRSTLAIANQPVQHDLGVSASTMGLLLGVFSWAYAFAQLPAGGMLDRWGPWKVLGGGLLLWSLAQALGGLAGNAKHLLVSRFLVGAGEAPTFPANAKVVATWFPQHARGAPIGLLNAASSLGPALAPPLLTWLMLAFGWRVMFLVAGAAGIVLAVVWFGAYRDRPAEAADEQHQPVSLREWLRLLRYRSTWGMVLGFSGVVYSIYLYLTWLPAYLAGERGLSLASTGLALILPYLVGAVGSLLSGTLGDVLTRRGVSSMTARKIPVIGGLLLGGLCTVPVALVPSTGLALTAITGAQFFLNVASGGGWAMASVAAEQRVVASLGSLQNFGGYFGGAFAPVVTGVLVDRTGSFVIALLAASAVAVLGALSYALLVREPVGEPPSQATEPQRTVGQ